MQKRGKAAGPENTNLQLLEVMLNMNVRVASISHSCMNTASLLAINIAESVSRAYLLYSFDILCVMSKLLEMYKTTNTTTHRLSHIILISVKAMDASNQLTQTTMQNCTSYSFSQTL